MVKKDMKTETIEMKAAEIKVGDIFYTSWGYDQTNYDYIIITAISATGKTATCKRVTHEHLGSTINCNIQKPTPSVFGDEFKMRVQSRSWSEGPFLRGSYPYCCDGKRETGMRLDTFWRWDGEKTFYETDSQFGH